MTTPAINKSNVALTSSHGYKYYHPCTGAPVLQIDYGVQSNSRIHTETRPASSNHPRNRAGWRNPGPWNHTRILDNPRPVDTIRQYQVLPGAGCTNGQYLENTSGSGWDLTAVSLPAFPSNLEGRAVSRALLKLKHQSVNLAVAFAERKQTINMFKHNVGRITRSVNAFKGKHPKLWGEVLLGNRKNTPNAWLELQYGWKPLISDLAGACQALSEAYAGGFNPYLARVKGMAASTDAKVWRKNSGLNSNIGFQVTDRWKSFCKVSLYYKLRNPTLAAFSSLGLTNPFELAWEKMKYSFVIDWVLPVGNWLSTLDADFGWDFHSGTLTKMTSGSSSSTFVLVGLPPSILRVDHLGDTYKSEFFSMTRTLYGSAPWGGIPRFKNPLSGLHVANAVALLSQAFRR